MFNDAESNTHVRIPNVKEQSNYELSNTRSLFYLTKIFRHFSPLVQRVLAVGLVGCFSTTNEPTGCDSRTSSSSCRCPSVWVKDGHVVADKVSSMLVAHQFPSGSERFDPGPSSP